MYDDGTPSREIQEEEKPQVSVVDIRDKLNSLHSLVHLCIVALNSKENLGQQYLQLKVAEVLCDFVGPEIKKTEEELQNI